MSSKTRLMTVTMRRLRLLGVVLFAIVAFASCGTRKDPTFDGSLLIGKWVNGTEYWRYDEGGSGATWDTSDDVSEDEAQPFEWEFDEEHNRLTQIHIMEMGGRIPKYYTVVTLDNNKLEYKDNYGSHFIFARVQQKHHWLY